MLALSNEQDTRASTVKLDIATNAFMRVLPHDEFSRPPIRYQPPGISPQTRTGAARGATGRRLNPDACVPLIH